MELHLGTHKKPSPLAKQLRANAAKKKRQDMERHVRNQQVALTHSPGRTTA